MVLGVVEEEDYVSQLRLQLQEELEGTVRMGVWMGEWVMNGG